MQQHVLRVERRLQFARAFGDRILEARLVGRQALLPLLAVGDVNMRGDVELQLAFLVLDLADEMRVPEGLPGLGVVQD
ncbi:MAG: hypothetical protein Q8Q62_21425, partial [Mesorhizobium sp.]|nr:hypothetical protein [Mesorhizobium sp.]